MGRTAKRFAWVLLVAGAFLFLDFASIPSFASTAPASFEAEIKTADGGKYQSLRLVPEIYNASNSDLSDLRVYDSKGEAVPYFIFSGTTETVGRQTVYTMEQIYSFVEFDAFFFDYKLLHEPEDADIIATSIEFTVRGEYFAKEVELFGSHDNINWESVQKDKLFSIDGSAKLYINFNAPQKFTHYRLKLPNNPEKIAFDNVNLVYDERTVSNSYFVEEFSPAVSVTEEERQTAVTLSGIKNLRLLDLRISSGSMFKRPVRAENGIQKELYNLQFSDTSVSDMTLPLEGYTPYGETFELTVENGDDKPIDIDSAAVRYYADELVFESKPGEIYTLAFGDKSITQAPVYDIARYKNEILNEEIEKAALGEIRYAAAVQETPVKEEFNYSLVFNVVVVCVAVLLGAVIVMMLRRKH